MNQTPPSSRPLLEMCLALSLASGLLGAAPASAQETGTEPTPANDSADSADVEFEREREASRYVQAGNAAFVTGQYASALEAFTKAHEIRKDPQLLMNIGSAHEHLGEYPEAIAALEAYVEAYPDEAERFEPRIAQMKRRIRAKVHKKELKALDATEKDAVVVEADSGAPPLNTGAIVLFALSGSGLVTVAVAGPMALSERSRLESSCAPLCTDEQLKKLKVRRTTADVGIGVAAAGFVGGVMAWLIPEPKESEHAWVRPYGGPTGAGAYVKGTF